jgi:hypothetical protein
MKKYLAGAIATGLLLAGAVTVFAAKPTSVDSNGVESAWEHTSCPSVALGQLTYLPGRYLEGEVIPTGFDVYGYNYQGHLFKGSYANVYLNGNGYPPYEGDDDAYYQRLVDDSLVTDITEAQTKLSKLWYWPYRDYDLQMKWNDAWLANTDCDNNGELDRHFGYDSYIGSGAWQTNQYSGKNGFAALTKIVAVPSDATVSGGYWYTADGVEIGQSIWGEFAIVQDILSGYGALYVSPFTPGYGAY